MRLRNTGKNKFSKLSIIIKRKSWLWNSVHKPAWKEILKGELDVKRAEINGNLTKLLKHLKAVERIIKVLNEMVDEGTFEFPDEKTD